MLRERVSRLVEELRDEHVDFLLLQEALRRKAAKFNLVHVISEALGLPHVEEYHRPATSYGLLTFSRHPLTRVSFELPDPATQMLATSSVVDGRRVTVINIHAAWGSFRGGNRLTEALVADDLARATFMAADADGRPGREERPVVVLAGDLNTAPDAPSLRFLTGRDNVGERSTLWLDAWDVAAPKGVTDHTIGAADADGHPVPNPLATIDVQSRGLTASYRPERIPDERYDFILVHEWAYGQAGEPVAARRFGTETFNAAHPLNGADVSLCISDHYGVLAELWMPA